MKRPIAEGLAKGYGRVGERCLLHVQDLADQGCEGLKREN